jgi:hypothetical protein
LLLLAGGGACLLLLLAWSRAALGSSTQLVQLLLQACHLALQVAGGCCSRLAHLLLQVYRALLCCACVCLSSTALLALLLTGQLSCVLLLQLMDAHGQPCAHLAEQDLHSPVLQEGSWHAGCHS